MKIFKRLALLVLISCTVSISFGQKTDKIATDEATLQKLKTAVEANPNDLKVHKAYIEAMGIQNPGLEKQYQVWIKDHPAVLAFPYALGKAYQDEESPKAKPYLLQTVKIDPKYTEAWGGLWIDAERWGDFAAGRDYLAKAVDSDPSNPNYAFYYASSFSKIDQDKYEKLSLAVAKRFPDHERGAQALYWLGARSKNEADKIKYFEMLYQNYPPAKFNWSASGVSMLYDLFLSKDPEKALAIAEDLAKDPKLTKEWTDLVAQAKTATALKRAIDSKDVQTARSLVKAIKLPRYFGFNNNLILIKAQIDDINGNAQAAYDSLINAFVKGPTVKIREAMSTYGSKLGKSSAQLSSDIWAGLNANAKVATPFTLKQYLAEGSSSLSDYKGKVVLLTYWFPGCGPCRGEFPHFENVVKKFSKADLAYLGINIVANQNDYVVPFMKTSGYSFIPLEDVDGRAKGNLDNRRAAPVNFLIDQEGKLMFSNFRTDGDNEEDLELMINFLLANKKA